jgi:hypothetical protein
MKVIPKGTAPEESARIKHRLSRKIMAKTILYIENKRQRDIRGIGHARGEYCSCEEGILLAVCASQGGIHST